MEIAKSTYVYSHTAVMVEIADSSAGVKTSETSAKDLTSEEPPAHVQVVDHEMMPLVTLLTVVHCEPLVASASPQRSL